MAVTFTGNYSVWGDRIVVFGDITLGGQTSGAVEIPGLKKIDFAVATYKTAATAGLGWTINAASGGTSTNGMLQIRSASTDGVYSVIALGR
jgi:hypothetical protein